MWGGGQGDLTPEEWESVRRMYAEMSESDVQKFVRWLTKATSGF